MKMTKGTRTLKPGLPLAMMLALSACGSSTVKLYDTGSGATGNGTFSGGTFGNTGPIKINVEGETYQGDWIAMRNEGNDGLTIWTVRPSDSGVGIANLSSPQGNRLRCEFGYSMVTLTGIGKCRRQDGRMYDMTAAY